MRIVVAGIGDVGLSNAVLLAQHNEVTAVDISSERVEMLNAGKSPVLDADIEVFWAERTLNLTASLGAKAA